MINSISFITNVYKVASGNILGQLFLIISSPIITRIYSPEIFGIFAICSSIVHIISSISPLRYDIAIVISKKDTDASNLLFISFLLTILSSIFSFFVLKMLNYIGLESNSIKVLSTYPGLISVSIMISALLIILISWETRFSQFAIIGKLRAIRALGTSTVPIIYGFLFKGSVYGLFLGDIIGGLIGLLFLIVVNIKQSGLRFLNEISREQSFSLLRRYKSFPIYSTWAVIVNSLSLQLPVIILISFYPVSVVGYYALANRMLQIPQGIINSSVGQVFFKTSKDLDHVHILVNKTLSRLLMIAFFPIIIISLIGSDLFQVVFGYEWYDAGLYAQSLSLWVFSAILVGPLAHLVNVYEKQKIGLLINILRMIFRLGSLLIGAFIMDNPIYTLVLFSVSGFVTNIGFLFWLLKISGSSIKINLLSFFKYGFIALAVTIPLIFIIQFFHISNIMKILISFIFLIGYYLYILSIDPGLRSLLKKTISLNN